MKAPTDPEDPARGRGEDSGAEENHRSLGSLTDPSPVREAGPKPSVSRYEAMLAMMKREGAARAAGSCESTPPTGIPFTAEAGLAPDRKLDVEIRFSKCGPADHGARFEIDIARAKSVQIAGDFNDWRPEPLRRDGAASQRWSVNKPLPRGEYRYKFVIDGEWMNDPLNPLRKPNPFGGTDSILRLTAGPSPAA
jgi:hypothetical protein